MVIYFQSTAVDPPATIYMGKDKYENEDLLRYGLPQDVWFHVDKLSSAHVYLRLPAAVPDWESIPPPLLADCAQLVKSNSIQGNKKKDLTIIYTPWSNVKKTGDLDVGTVQFHNAQKVRRTYVQERDTAVLHRLNRTRVERQVDHEAERQERLKQQGREKKARAGEEKNQRDRLTKQRMEEMQARDYGRLFTDEAMAQAQAEREARNAKRAAAQERAAKGGDQDDSGAQSDDSFM